MPPDDEDEVPRSRSRSSSSMGADIALLHERQRSAGRRIDGINERLEAIEKKQGEVSTLLNKALGAVALLMAVGAFIGWAVSIGGNIFKWIKP